MYFTFEEPFPSPMKLRFAKVQALKVIERELGRPLTSVFDHIPDTPAAAASLGQVYQATMLGGQTVAVKVRRPGVVERLELDAHVLRTIAEAVQYLLPTRHGLVSLCDELIGRIFEEVDYRREAANAERFRRLCAGEFALRDGATFKVLVPK
eukprot:gene18172-21649_t